MSAMDVVNARFGASRRYRLCRGQARLEDEGREPVAGLDDADRRGAGGSGVAFDLIRIERFDLFANARAQTYMLGVVAVEIAIAFVDVPGRRRTCSCRLVKRRKTQPPAIDPWRALRRAAAQLATRIYHGGLVPDC